MGRWLKRWLKRLSWPRPAQLLATGVLLGLFFLIDLFPPTTVDVDMHGDEPHTMAAIHPMIDVTIRNMYRLGPPVLEHHHLSPEALQQFLMEEPDLVLVEMNHGERVYERRIDDLSPEIKERGRFGISPDGTMIFYEEGADGEKNILETFFQLNLDRLESDAGETLKALKIGIPVRSWQEYEQVLKVFQSYAKKDEQ